MSQRAPKYLDSLFLDCEEVCLDSGPLSGSQGIWVEK